MARFYGRTPSNETAVSLVNEQPPLFNQELVVTNKQQNQAALFVYKEMSSEVKNLCLEIASLKESIELRSEYDIRKPMSKKSPKGLPVSGVIA